MFEDRSEADSVEKVVSRLQEEFPGWTIDTVFEFGSRARNEAVTGSDIDLWVLLHSDTRILMDKTFQRMGRYKSSFPKFQSDHESFEMVEVDTWGYVVGKIKPKWPLMLSCPVADTRWFLWQLAMEADWQTFLYTVFARPLYDRMSLK